MESFTTMFANLLVRTPAKQCQSLPYLAKRGFHNKPPMKAISTITATPGPAPTLSNRPRSEAAALLGLDTPAADSQDLAKAQEALQESRARLLATQSAREKASATAKANKGMERLFARRWRGGDLYTPHDITPREIMGFRTKQRPSKDIFDALGLNPIDAYKNPVLLAEFMTSGGKIKHPNETGLRPVNQRKLAKAIRRATGMGLMPKCHVHPEMLRRMGPDQRSQKYQWH